MQPLLQGSCDSMSSGETFCLVYRVREKDVNLQDIYHALCENNSDWKQQVLRREMQLFVHQGREKTSQITPDTKNTIPFEMISILK